MEIEAVMVAVSDGLITLDVAKAGIAQAAELVTMHVTPSPLFKVEEVKVSVVSPVGMPFTSH